jgi:hypothetical protein
VKYSVYPLPPRIRGFRIFGKPFSLKYLFIDLYWFSIYLDWSKPRTTVRRSA